MSSSLLTVMQNCVDREVSLGRGMAGAFGRGSWETARSLKEAPFTRSMNRTKEARPSRPSGCMYCGSKRPEGPGEHCRSMMRVKFLDIFSPTRGLSNGVPCFGASPLLVSFCIHTDTTSWFSPGAESSETISS